jgi:type I site-specific restriction endonuclease
LLRHRETFFVRVLQTAPEQQARVRIDRMLEDAGWVVLDYADADFAAGPGVAIREFMTVAGPVDYLLVADRKAVGSLEAKKEGETLRQVEAQANRYADGFEELVKTRNIPRYADRLPFHYISTGTETLFTSRRDPIRRPREVFHFHKPETLAAWATDDPPYRTRLRMLPALNAAGLRDVQEEAIKNLEASLADDRPRALAAITMGGGKTRFAVAESYRLLRFAEAKRILFLVDRISLGDQAKTEFLSFTSPDDGRRFGDLFGVQILRSNRVDRSANVVICTIQRLYSMLRGEADDALDEELDECVVGQDEIRAFYGRADIFCLPSFAEGIPVVAMEAMAMELPVVSTRIMGVPELVEDGEGGLLVPPGRADLLTDALRRLVRFPEERRRMGSAGRRKVIRDFDVEASAQRMRAVLETELR